MKTLALKMDHELREFDPKKRERTEGLFLLFQKDGDFLLIVDESGKMFLLALFVVLDKHGIQKNALIGAGRYRRRATRFDHADKAWQIGIERGTGSRLSRDLISQIAETISAGEGWVSG